MWHETSISFHNIYLLIYSILFYVFLMKATSRVLLFTRRMSNVLQFPLIVLIFLNALLPLHIYIYNYFYYWCAALIYQEIIRNSLFWNVFRWKYGNSSPILLTTDNSAVQGPTAPTLTSTWLWIRSLKPVQPKHLPWRLQHVRFSSLHYRI